MIRFSLLKSKETLVVTIIGTGPGGPARRAKTVFFRLRNYLTQLDDYVSKQRLEVCTIIVNVSLVAMPEAGRGKKGNNSQLISEVLNICLYSTIPTLVCMYCLLLGINS